LILVLITSMDELPVDIINLLVAADPVAFLGVSKQTRTAACAAISAEMVAYCPGEVKYGKMHVCVGSVHSTASPDVHVGLNGSVYHFDINTKPYTQCCDCCNYSKKYKWFTTYGYKPIINCRVIMLAVIAAASGYRTLPHGFGE